MGDVCKSGCCEASSVWAVSARKAPAFRKDATAVIHDGLGPRLPWRGTLYSWPEPVSLQAFGVVC